MVNQREVEVVYSPLQFINNQRDERNGKYILGAVRNTFLSSSIGHDHTKGVISVHISVSTAGALEIIAVQWVSTPVTQPFFETQRAHSSVSSESSASSL